jgi:uridine kinase
MKSRLVAIVGGSGAGKSFLADRLQAALGASVGRISLDDFYRDRSHLPLGRRAKCNFDHPRSIDWRTFEAALQKIQAGRAVRLPVYDFAIHARLRRIRRWHSKPVVLVEGLWLLHRRTLRRLFDYAVFVECRTSLRFQRRLRRDRHERGRSAESIRAQFQATVAPMHHRFVMPQALWADRVLRSPVSRREFDCLVEELKRVISATVR